MEESVGLAVGAMSKDAQVYPLQKSFATPVMYARVETAGMHKPWQERDFHVPFVRYAVPAFQDDQMCSVLGLHSMGCSLYGAGLATFLCAVSP